jgi:hypothetical protein
MGWFGRRKRPATRFPVDRWESLFMNRMIHVMEKSKRYDVEISMTRFYAGYLVGFPNYVALHDEKLPGAIRKGLLGICYGNELPALIGRIEECAVLGDPQFDEGIQAGTEDGERFFKAVEGQRKSLRRNYVYLA